MDPERIRTGAFLAAGALLVVQFVVQQIGEGIHPSGIVLLAAAGIFLGLAAMRIRSPPPKRERDGLGIGEFALLVLVGVLAIITTGLVGLALR